MYMLWRGVRNFETHVILLQTCRNDLEGSPNQLGWIKHVQTKYLALVEQSNGGKGKRRGDGTHCIDSRHFMEDMKI